MLSHISQQMEEIKAMVVSSTCLYLFIKPQITNTNEPEYTQYSKPLTHDFKFTKHYASIEMLPN